jgi:hypothetical protein
MKVVFGGQNRTGTSRDPAQAEAMVAATVEFPPSSPGDATAISAVRAEYARSAEPMGTMPAPAGVGDLARKAVQAMTGARPIVLLDKLGLYDALISKHDAGRSFRGGPTRDDLVHIREEEHEHFTLISEAIRELGGDPTVVTPSANLQATASKGLPAVLADSRTDLLQCLEAILTAELVDNDCWSSLIEVAEQAGEEDLTSRFGAALEHEREHLERVRTWVAAGTARSVERALESGAATARTPADRRSSPQRKKAQRAPKKGRRRRHG